jgi:hypothetical protein
MADLAQNKRRMVTAERWAVIPGFEGYEASSAGRIRSVERLNSRGQFRRGRVLASHPRKHGYAFVVLYRDGVRHQCTVHRLVTLAFHGRPHRYKTAAGKIRRMEARHINGIKSNCRARNLCWGTRAENDADKIVHGTVARGERNGNSKLTETKARAILAAAGTHRTIAARYGISPSLVGQLKGGACWAHLQPQTQGAL